CYFPLTGILKCPVCEAGMTIMRSTRKRKDGGTALKGDAMGFKLGEGKLPTNSIEGYIAKEVYDKSIGDSVFRRITPIVNILIWVGICENGRGKLILK
ncbi:MAG: hypothetical protein RSD47_11315, partial [Romboutsia sp.]